MPRRSPLPPYLVWRDGRPRWVPGPRLRPAWKARDLKDGTGHWLGLEAAITAAREINAEVAAWKAGGAPKRPKAPKAHRTCDQLWRLYIATPEFRMLAAKTRADYESKAAVWLASGFADVPVRSVGRAALKGLWRELYDERGHPMANGVLAVARTALTFATDLEWIAVNPAFKLGLKTVAPRVAFWSPAKIAALIETADAVDEPAVADAVIIALHSGQRQGDVLAMPARIFDDERIRLTQFKRGALVDAPLTPPLAARVALIRSRWRQAGVAARATIVADPTTGAAYGGDAFRKAFSRVRAAAAARHPELAAAERMQPALADLRFQDLRDTAVTRLAMAGCNLGHVASITGHSPEHITGVIRHYLAVNASLADEAIRLLTLWLDREGIAV